MPKKRSRPKFSVSFLVPEKLVAAGLMVSVAVFCSAPPTFGQQAPQQAASPVPSGQQVAPSASSADAQVDPTPVAIPTMEQSARARDLFRKGTDALKQRKSAQAVRLFGEAHRLDPANAAYLAAFEVARQQQVGVALDAARTEQRMGHAAEARQQLEAALKLDPGNPYVRQGVQSLVVQSEPAVISSTAMPRFSSGLVELAPKENRATFHLRASAQQIVRRTFLAYGITALVDDSVSTKQVRLDLDNATYAETATAVELATGTFVVPLDSTHALVAKDTKENRAKFQRLLMETVYLPGISDKQMSDAVKLVQSVFEVHQVSARPDSGVMSIRAPEGTLRAINATLSGLYIAKPNIVLDVRVYQVSHTRDQKLGLSFPQSLTIFNVSSELASIISSNQSTVEQLIAAGLVNPGDLAGIAALLVGMGLASGTILDQPFALFGGGLTLSGLSFPGASIQASLTLSHTKELDHVQLRVGDSEKEAFLVGSRYPVVTQSYSAGTQIPTNSQSLAGLIGGASQAGNSPVNPLSFAPSVQYIDLGLTVKAVAQVVQNDDLNIQLQVKIASLSGAALNESPIIDNRSFTTQIQVPNNGSALIASNITQSESRSLSGIPGLSELPGFGWTASPSTQLTAGKLLIVITPHIISGTRSAAESRMVPVEQASTK